MNSWNDLKEKIKEETKDFFSGKASVNVSEVIDLLERVLIAPLNDPTLKLDGMGTRIYSAFEKILDEGLGKNDKVHYFTDFAKVEQYLRKILFFIKPNEYYSIQNQKSGLAALIKALKLNPNKMNFDNILIETFSDNRNFDKHLLRVYKLRNIESHQCQAWTNRELYENVESILIFYLYVTHKYYAQLKTVVDVNEIKVDFTEYLEQVKNSFKTRISRFVHIEGQENIKLSHGYVVENIIDEESEVVERKGTVDDLRNNNVPKKRMILWGEAGMGKSTTLEYLSYIDAEKRIKNSNAKIPVYIPLGLLTDKNLSVKQSIFNKLGVDTMVGEQMLKRGEINIFLDAINEIPRDDNYQLKNIRLKEIQNLLNEYKNTFIILSDRPQDENIYRGVPVFCLQKMGREQIEDFLRRNTDEDTEIMKNILNEIDNDNRLEKIIKTPLMLSRLIEIVKATGEIPKSEGEIIHKFIYSLYMRERKEKMDANFEVKKIHRLLRYLGHESLEKKDTNAGMSEDEVLNYFVKCKKDYGFDIDTVYVLEKATQLGILEKQDELYTFAHQAYQDYYHSQEERGILGF